MIRLDDSPSTSIEFELQVAQALTSGHGASALTEAGQLILSETTKLGGFKMTCMRPGNMGLNHGLDHGFVWKPSDPKHVLDGEMLDAEDPERDQVDCCIERSDEGLRAG